VIALSRLLIAGGLWPNVIAVCEPGDIPFGILSVFPGGWCCASPSGGALGMFAGFIRAGCLVAARHRELMLISWKRS